MISTDHQVADFEKEALPHLNDMQAQVILALSARVEGIKKKGVFRFFGG